MTQIMGIVNVTPDSFYAGSRCPNIERAVARALKMVEEGADILDIGGESTRPGAIPIGEAEELKRVIPVIREVRRRTPLPLSIDTMKVGVAREALAAGATMINDISGFRDPDMRRLAAESGADLCLMHMPGVPATMQQLAHYPEGVVPHLLRYFEEQVELLLQAGVKSERIILDPGIGFGKTVADNLQIIQNLPLFKIRGFRLLLGVSRKSFMYKILNKSALDALPATLAINTLAVKQGVDIIRVHDVEEHRDLVKLLMSLSAC